MYDSSIARRAWTLAPLLMLVFSGITAAEPAAPPNADGPSKTFDKNGILIAEDNYLAGVLHGPSRRWNGRGTLMLHQTYKNGKLHGRYHSRLGLILSTDGQYAEGARDGEWLKLSNYGNSHGKSIQRFRRGVREGKWEYQSNKLPEPIQITFKDGKLIDSPAELKDLPLLKRIGELSGPVKPPDERMERIVDALFEQSNLEYPETPLHDVVQDIVDLSGISICLDRPDLERNKLTLKTPFTINCQGVPLIVGLARIAKADGLTLDYRYHGVWLTRQDTAASWKGDATGAMALTPRKGSLLEKTLEEVWKPKPEEADPKDLLTVLEERGIKLDISAAATKPLRDNARMVRHVARGMTTREMLAFALYQSACVCREENGKLIIEPQSMVE